jgi:flagellar biosynthesis protein FliP
MAGSLIDTMQALGGGAVGAESLGAGTLGAGTLGAGTLGAESFGAESFEKTASTAADMVSAGSLLSGQLGVENLSPPLQIAFFLGSMAFLTAILVSVTSFTRIIIVLSFVRRALTTQEIPPNPSLIGFALFMTLFTMGPVFDSIHERAIVPLLKEEATPLEALDVAVGELRGFMLYHTRRSDLGMFHSLAGIEISDSPEETPTRVLIPAFMISELKTAFIMGFCIYVPFILIDLLVSTILMSLGMMMMPPVIVSAPIKLLLFVLVDGWHLIARALGSSFS